MAGSSGVRDDRQPYKFGVAPFQKGNYSPASLAESIAFAGASPAAAMGAMVNKAITGRDLSQFLGGDKNEQAMPSMQERASGIKPGQVVGRNVETQSPVVAVNSPVVGERAMPEEYAIREGATLSGITGGDMEKVKELAAYNNIKNPDLIYAGAKLKIPATMQLNNLNQFLSAM